MPTFPGRSPTLLALHGFAGLGRDFEALHAHLPFAMEAPDLPGHGDRPLLPAFQDLADALAIGRPRGVLGYSMGARVALDLALRHRDALEALVLLSGAAGLADPQARAARRSEDEAWARMLEAQGLAGFFEAWDRRELFEEERLDVWRERFLARRSLHDATALAEVLRRYGTGAMPPLWDALPMLDLPVLLLTGERDAKFRALGEALASQLPDAVHVVVPGAGHRLHLERPREVGEAIAAFLIARGVPTP